MGGALGRDFSIEFIYSADDTWDIFQLMQIQTFISKITQVLSFGLFVMKKKSFSHAIDISH